MRLTYLRLTRYYSETYIFVEKTKIKHIEKR